MVITDTLTIIQPVGAFLVPVNYDMIGVFLGVVFALALIVFLEVLLDDKDVRLAVYLRFGLWCLVGGLFWCTGNYGLGYAWFQFYVVVVFVVELARSFQSVV